MASSAILISAFFSSSFSVVVAGLVTTGHPGAIGFKGYCVLVQGSCRDTVPPCTFTRPCRSQCEIRRYGDEQKSGEMKIGGNVEEML